MNLTRLAGNERIKEQLSGAAHLPHAIILGGPEGCGKHTLARLLAQAMVCEGPGEVPCGICRSCRQVEQEIYPDMPPMSSFVDPKDRDKKGIVVETIRNLRRDVFIRPNQGRRKIYRIDQADKMNLESQNALLKVLEDGPDYAAFLLLTENPLVLLPTIRSRCVRYDLAPVFGQEALELLKSRFPQREEQELQAAISAVDGVLGQAIRQLEGQWEDPKITEALTDLAKALTHRSELELMEWSVGLQNDKLTREQLGRLYQALLEAMAAALTGAPAGQIWRDCLTRRQQAELSQLARTGLQAVEGNISPGHSLGWFAVSAWELLRDRQG
ncbi:MAG: ATP-binding protein [Candidatus Onthomonas sp.]